jgi:hypothetical protein
MVVYVAIMNSLVIKVISGYLDWESRLNLNLALPSYKRVGAPISKENIYAHEKYVIVELFKGKMADFDILSKRKKVHVISEIFVRLMQPRYKVLYICNAGLRETVYERASSFSNAKLNNTRDEMPPNDAKLLAEKARHLKKLINAGMKNKALKTQEYCMLFNTLKARPIELCEN